MKRIYAANEKQWREICEKSWYRDKTLRVDEVKKGIILPSRPIGGGLYAGGVCTERFDFVAGFLRNSDDSSVNPGWSGINTSYKVPDNELQIVEDKVIFGGVIHGRFGHFILESMSRLWYIFKYPEDCRCIAFTNVEGMQDWFWDFFDLLGIARERILFVERPTQFSQVTIPEESVHSWYYYTSEYHIPYTQLINVTEGGGLGKKLYLTRSSYERENGPQHYNEDYFEKFYFEKGFKIISPEKYSIEEQIRMVRNAEEVVSTLASLSHFALFCKPDTRFTMLAKTEQQVLPAQCLVNEASGVDWTIVDISVNILYGTREIGPILLGPNSYWQEYVLDRYGERVNNITSIKESCWDYLCQWAKFYSNQKRFKKIQNKDAYDFLERLHRTTHGKPLPFKRPDLLPSEKEKESTIECIRLRNALKNLQHLLGNTDQIVQTEEERPLVEGDIHVAGEGWINGFYETEEWQGQKKPTRHIEALRCRFIDDNDNPEWRVSYRVRDKDGHWGQWITNGEMAGTTGQSAPLTGITFRFDSGPATRYSVRYRIRSTKSGSEWSTWVKDGGDCVVEDGLGIAGIQVELINKAFAQSGS